MGTGCFAGARHKCLEPPIIVVHVRHAGKALSSNQPRILGLRFAVGAVCASRKAAAVPDMHFASSRIDETAPFQHLQSNGNPWASCSKHDGEKLVGDRKAFAVDPIVTH